MVELSERVYFLVRAVPSGRVTTYGQLGAMVGVNDARTIGDIMNASPPDVPWQRVINSRGEISIQGATGARQRDLLEEEGIIFDENNRVNFAECGWVPDPEWLKRQGYKIPPPFAKDKKAKSDADQLNLF